MNLKACLMIAIISIAPLALTKPAAAACPGDTQMEMNACAGLAYQEADKHLNKVYKTLPRTPELVAAEKAWIAFRDAQCTYEAQAVEGGSMQPLVYASCLQSVTEDRIKQLTQPALGQ